MKSLIVLRHGKSEWQLTNESDHDRSLKPRGKTDAKNIGIELSKRDVTVPDLMISSSANRALTSIKIVRQYFGGNVNFDIQNAFYTFSLDKVLENLGQVDSKINHLMIVGHNPAYTDLINYLTNSDLDNLPTSGTALITLNIENWDDIFRRCGILEDLILPKSLR